MILSQIYTPESSDIIMRRLILYSLTFFPIFTFAQAIDSKQFLSPDSLKPHLSVPFGKICSMEVVVVRGDDLKLKVYEGTYLLKVQSVNGEKLPEPILFSFQDKTGRLPGSFGELYRSNHKKSTGAIAVKEIQRLELNYVGRHYLIVAYETGQFIGFPEGYFDYQPIQSGTSFHFENSLVVLSINSKTVNNN